MSDADPARALTLPYQFDTTNTGRAIKTGLFLVQGLIGTVLLLELASGSWLKVAGGLICLALVTAVGIGVFRKVGGTTGRITQSDVEVSPNTLYGIRADGAIGTFPLERFHAVRVERVGPDSIDAGSPAQAPVATGQHERIILLGRDATPDIRVANTVDLHGLSLGRALAALLRLPFEVVSRPY